MATTASTSRGAWSRRSSGVWRSSSRRSRSAQCAAGATVVPTSSTTRHFHLTNYIQEGTEHPRLPEDHGHARSAASRCSASRCSSSGRTSNTGDFAPTYYLQTDAPLYYYSFTDAFIAMAYRSLHAGRAGALRSDDHRVQPGRHVRGRSHPPRADDVPGRVHRHRRVHDPQGVRVVEDRRRDRQPHQPGARPPARFRGRGRARRAHAQRRRHAVPEAGAGARIRSCSCATCSAGTRTTTIIWAHTGLGRVDYGRCPTRSASSTALSRTRR